MGQQPLAARQPAKPLSHCFRSPAAARDRYRVSQASLEQQQRVRLNVSLTVHHELTIQNYQRDALNIIYSSNILLYMFRVSSTHLQEDIVVHSNYLLSE